MLKKLISLKIAPGENRGHFTSFGVVTFFYILCRRQRPVLVDKTVKSVDLFELSEYNVSFSFVTYKSCTYIRVIFCNIFDTIFTNFSFHFRNSCATILSRINISSTTICQRGGSCLSVLSVSLPERFRKWRSTSIYFLMIRASNAQNT